MEPEENQKRKLSLRERKKAKTRASIQAEALRLFRERGYGDTTVEQIADAAEVSPATFFRYFPTKEDVVIYDTTDPVLFDSLRKQPKSLDPVAALRAALKEAFADASQDEIDIMTERDRLIRNVPELRAKFMNVYLDTLQSLRREVAARIDKREDDLSVQVLVGVVVGISMTSWLGAEVNSPTEFLTRLDRSLAYLESRLRF